MGKFLAIFVKNDLKNGRFWVSQNLASVFPIPVGLRQRDRTRFRREYTTSCFHRKNSPFREGAGFARECGFAFGLVLLR